MLRNLGLAQSSNTTTFRLPRHIPGSKSRGKAQQPKSLQTTPSIIWTLKKLLHGWCKKGYFQLFSIFYPDSPIFQPLLFRMCPSQVPNQVQTASLPGQGTVTQGHLAQRIEFCPLENMAITSLVTSGAFCLHLQQSNTVPLAARITLESICKLLSLLESHLAIIASSAILTHRSPQNSNGKSRVITLFTEANQYIKAEDLLHWRQPVCMARKRI